jgi:hypothetical protein
MPILFEEVTGEVAPSRGVDTSENNAPAPAMQDAAHDLREKLVAELALLRERQARLHSD